jgi:hypothetical protein
MRDAEKLDFLHYALERVAAQVQRAIEAANCHDVTGVRIEIERLAPPLMAAGRIVRQLEFAKVRALTEEHSLPEV